MNFITFSVNTTNIFPCANTAKGGQLVTEFNLKSRESVSTDPSISYITGPSYVHSENDFMVTNLSDTSEIFGDISVSSTTICISEGRGVINGHYIETLAPMIVDLAEANKTAILNNDIKLSGKLAVGFKVMYSTQSTMAGSILAENSNDMYEGIQVVILPESEFKLPVDVPDDINKVTAHIKLATFNYYNGVVSDIVNNYPDKCKMIQAVRIGDIESLVSKSYVKKSGLNPKKLYTYAGKGNKPDNGNIDTWCDATDALMLWDSNPTLINTADVKQLSKEAEFLYAGEQVYLYLPHKQVDYEITNTAGEPQCYAPKIYPLPVADFTFNTPGTVSSEYTKQVKKITNLIHNLYNLPNGTQRGYISELNSKEDLPPINSAWEAGDYILVGQDHTLNIDKTSYGQDPATLYVVLPGIVGRYSQSGEILSGIMYCGSNTVDTPRREISGKSTYELLDGVELSRAEGTSEPVHDVGTSVWKPEYDAYWNVSGNNYRGIIGHDFFTYVYTNPDTNKITYYYYVVTGSTGRSYSDPLMITGDIPLAQEELVGGFLNVPDTALDYGYIYRDEEGHLRLLDYELLRSGTLAYQLGTDFTVPTGITAEEVQGYLDEYVNNRVAFPNSAQMKNSDTPNIIHLYITLTAEEDASTLDIYNIDSRFNTSVYIHILGTANNKTTINISDCERVRIDSNIGGTPNINLYRSSLYYDATVLNTLSVIRDLKLWYERFSSTDANLIVDNMTVREVDTAIITSTLDSWNNTTTNDNHFSYGLQSLTFGTNGTIIGCTIIVRNDATANTQIGKYIIAGKFTLPQGAGLTYPIVRLTKPLKVTGQFIAAYPISDPVGYMVQDTSFTLLTQSYNPDNISDVSSGSVSFMVDASYVTSVTGIATGTSIDGWESNSFHIFNGGTIS